MINNVVLVGRTTKDPELRYTNNNKAYVYFQLAVNRTFADQDGNKHVDFISCVVWSKAAENFSKYVTKGSLIGVEGRIQTSTSKDKNGNTTYSTQVIVGNVQYLQTNNQNTNNNARNNNQGNRNNNRYNNNNNNNNYDDFLNDTVNPFTDDGFNFNN